MLRVSFTLFNLQGTRSTAFQLSVRYILAHSLSLVKHFFQKFFASYSAALSFKLVRSRRGTRLFYHTLLTLSSTFFKSRSKSIQLPLGFFSLFDSFQCPLVRRSDRIPPHTAFVNTFFHFFFPFFVFPFSPLNYI